jgi:hypothetical protein
VIIVLCLGKRLEIELGLEDRVRYKAALRRVTGKGDMSIPQGGG